MQCYTCWKDYSGFADIVVKFVTNTRKLRAYNDRVEFLPPFRAEFKNEWIFTTTPTVFADDVYRELPYLYLYVEV